MSSLADQPDDPSLAKLRAGEPLTFPALPTAAKWLEGLATSPARVVAVPVVISNAIVDGPLDLQYASFEFGMSITGTTFKDAADFSFAVFNRTAMFEGSAFGKPVSFRSAQAEADFYLIRTSLANGSTFQDLQVRGVLGVIGADFGRVDFERIDVGKGALFTTDDKGHPCTFGGEARFFGAHIRGNAEIRGAEFKAAAIFAGALVEGSVYFFRDHQDRSVTFKGEAAFVGAHIHRDADFSGAEFKMDATFDSIQVDGNAFFRSHDDGRRVTFGGEARFLHAHIRGFAEFSGAEFKAKATFDAMQVDGDVFLRSDARGQHVIFGGESRFLGAHIRGNSEFDGAEFKAKATFDGMQVDGGAFFRSDAQGQHSTFGGESRFLGVRVGGPVDFSGAEFKAEAYFDDFQVSGTAFFGIDHEGRRVEFNEAAAFPSATFKSHVLFVEAEFKGSVSFSNTHFLGAAGFQSAGFVARSQTTFVGARFERGAYFDSARFKGETDFTAAIASRDISFLDVEFSGPVNFREASFQVVSFGQPARAGSGSYPSKRQPGLLRQTRFGDEHSVDLRGLTYDRIYVDLDQLFPRIATTDRQPYTQLERTLRKTGDDPRASKVYLERRRVERERMFSEGRFARWATDWLYNVIARYGIRPYRLIGYSLLVLILGTGLFLRPEALRMKAGKNSSLPATVSTPSGNAKDGTSAAPLATDDPFSTRFERALGVSVHQFLPIDVPVGSDWVPAPGWPSAYSTIFLRLTGAILVGIGLGSVTGLLRRVSP